MLQALLYHGQQWPQCCLLGLQKSLQAKGRAAAAGRWALGSCEHFGNFLQELQAASLRFQQSLQPGRGHPPGLSAVTN